MNLKGKLNILVILIGYYTFRGKSIKKVFYFLYKLDFNFFFDFREFFFNFRVVLGYRVVFVKMQIFLWNIELVDEGLDIYIIVQGLS